MHSVALVAGPQFQHVIGDSLAQIVRYTLGISAWNLFLSFLSVDGADST